MSLRQDPPCEPFKKPIPATCPFVWTAHEILPRDMSLQHVPSCEPTFRFRWIIWWARLTVLLKCAIRSAISFRCYAFPNFCKRISRPLAYGVRISSEASAIAEIAPHPNHGNFNEGHGAYSNTCTPFATSAFRFLLFRWMHFLERSRHPKKKSTENHLLLRHGTCLIISCLIWAKHEL